jgi:iron(III) transport system permease protein
MRTTFSLAALSYPKRNGVPAGWTMAVAAVLALLTLPIATIVALAISPSDNIWPHLLSTVLPAALADTLLLSGGAALVTLVVGTGTAWLVTMYRFPGRVALDRLLVLPLAIPTYIVAYCYVDLLDYAGPVQSALRAGFGFATPRDYWFPDIRSLGGAVFIFSVVLYPYVYLAARATFVQQSVCALEVARTLGRTPLGTFRDVALPLARPALAAGTALVIMECLNDLGAVLHLGLPTLSASVYATWTQRGNLGGAAQLATAMLTIVIIVMAAERYARGGARIHHTTGRYRSIPFQDLAGWHGYAAAAIAAIPVLAGFGIPIATLAHNALRYTSWDQQGEGLIEATFNSLSLASISALAAVAIALLLAYARRIVPNALTRLTIRTGGYGYAVPGVVLAIGLMISLAGIDNWIDGIGRSWFGVSTGLLLSGSVFALVVAYTIRFLAVALGTIEAALQRISPNLDAAARALGETALSSLRRVHVPLLLPALGAAGLVVFVDALKELPATLLLRPFNFETLATHVYSLASLEQVEQATLGALAIVFAGLVPVLLLHKAVASGRAGSGSG